MANANDFAMQPTEVADATKQLDELADRIEKVMHTAAPNLTVTASGRDEVSQRVASTLNQVHGDFVRASDQGTNEVREVAATLRKHTDSAVSIDQGFAV
ncbi:PE family protein [Mycolicibacterium senegalense]|uniref:PE family protein n=1 Tax=Mycobacteriaceae TaxID=1762 RepID=UPI003AAE0323